MGDDTVMHQKVDEDFVTSGMCEMHHKLMESQLELLRQKDKQLEEKISGIERSLEKMDAKLDVLSEKQEGIIKWQADQYKLQLGMAILLVTILIGVVLGRGLDFGIFSP
jgi:hypothetical protein